MAQYTNKITGHVSKDIYEKMELFIHQSLSHHKLEVLEFTDVSPLPPGDNFCSLIIRVSLSVRQIDNDDRDTLALIAKIGMEREIPFVNWPNTLKKELFVYNELLPTYRDIQRQAGINEADLIDFLPRNYNVHKDFEDPNHHNSILLLENLKHQSYYCLDKDIGIDIDHAHKALSSLAEFHALGIAFKQKWPTRWSAAIKTIRLPTVREFIYPILEETISKTLKSREHLAKYINILKLSFEYWKNLGYSKNFEPKEPWATITHGDTWANNVFFCKNLDGDVDRVKFIDYQLSNYGSPLIDLTYFFCTSFNEETLENDIENLINIYYEGFIKTLSSVGCDISPFTRHSFDAELKEIAKVNFGFCMTAHKFYSVDHHEDLQEGITKNSNDFLYRAIKVVNIYERNNWF